MSISDARRDKALFYLAETDEECAKLEANMERAEFKAKAVRDAFFLTLEGSVAERTAKAGCSDEYVKAMDDYFAAIEEFRKVRNKRNTETIVVDVWRSIQANQRKGFV
jgi:hypothetical protein